VSVASVSSVSSVPSVSSVSSVPRAPSIIPAVADAPASATPIPLPSLPSFMPSFMPSCMSSSAGGLPTCNRPLPTLCSLWVGSSAGDAKGDTKGEAASEAAPAMALAYFAAPAMTMPRCLSMLGWAVGPTDPSLCCEARGRCLLLSYVLYTSTSRIPVRSSSPPPTPSPSTTSSTVPMNGGGTASRVSSVQAFASDHAARAVLLLPVLPVLPLLPPLSLLVYSFLACSPPVP
jgi:hypothetical protein